MNHFQDEIMKQLTEVVSARCGGRMMQHKSTEAGFYADFDMPAPLNPETFADISERMRTRKIPAAYALERFSGAYLNGDATGKSLQRIYVVAFASDEELAGYERAARAAEERDHRRLGAQLRLFSSSEDIGQGLVLWHPKGAAIRHALEQFSQSAHLLNDYQWVYSPHIGRGNLWVTSGHLDFYRDSMYSPISIDEEEYYLKPMNCPFHIEIYKSEARSYRDLPIRLAEFGTVYRYELSGTLSGLARVRGFTQDDAHIFATPEQIEGEVARALKFSLYVLRAFGLNDFRPYIATKPEKKSIGSDADWERATEILKRAVESAGLEYEIDEGGGAFYGPKIDLNVRDCLGRERQLSTVQFDFNLPGRFGLQYIGRDGKPHEPFMIHRALFGSVERFTALLIEHYAGEFPLWFAPVQFGIVPIRPEHCEYCAALSKELKRKGLRVEADLEDENMREKIKRFEREKVPYILIAGDREIEKRGFSVRSRKEGQVGFMAMKELMEKIAPDLALGTPRYLEDN